MSSESFKALRYDFEDRLRPDEVPDELRENPFCVRSERRKINCPEPGCNKPCNVVEIGGEKKFLCRDKHQKPYDESHHVYWKVETVDAVEELLTDLGFEASVEQNGSMLSFESGEKSFLVVPGGYSDDLLQPIASQLKDHRNFCVLAFQDDTKRGIKPLIDRAGGVSMVATPPGLERKIESFESMIEVRNEFEAEYEPQREAVPEDLVEKINDNPQFLVGELTDFEKIEASSEKRDKMEKLCTLSFSQVLDCPLHPMGMEDTGNRVPDGFGFIFDEENGNHPTLLLDSKSVSSEYRDYPKITEKHGPQYRKYLEIVDDVCYRRQWEEKVIVFISPEFNISKIEDFLDELNRTKFDDFQAVFMDLKALATLILHRTSHTSERSVRLTRGGWTSILYDLFLDPDFDRSEQDYELGRNNGLCLTESAVQQHFANNIPDQKSRERTLEYVEEEIREFSPE
ncbi:hypothetical protein ACFO5R_00760 [Halosolutus amylolyticus]|uniref:Uncharacterized protein n=1 Tax=Halosolutus amylolyticus TaxID=2932267 RepID=A0ABD5PJ82_9EURY|nr:hypothetical protein [Halosolutus amylolyticus]